MENGDKDTAWGIVFKVSQLVAPLILMAMVYLMIQQSGFDRRLAVIEAISGRPQADTALIARIAVIEDRQNNVIKQLAENGDRIDRIGEMLVQHDESRSWGGRGYNWKRSK